MPQRCRGQVARNEGGPGARVQAARFELMRLVPSEPVAESDRTLPAGARRGFVMAGLSFAWLADGWAPNCAVGAASFRRAP